MSTTIATAATTSGLHDAEHEVRRAGEAARVAALALATATRGAKDAALLAMADRLERDGNRILAANAADVSAAAATGTPDAMLDRLRLDSTRVAAMAEGLRDVARLADPVGELVRGSRLANGLELRQVRVPLGVVAIVYEARPNVTSDAAGLCLKSGNAVILRGSSSAAVSNAAIVDSLRAAVEAAGLPADAIRLLTDPSRASVRALQRARGLVDALIPRGGADLIRSVVENSSVPVIETGIGNCHVYVDRDADLVAAVPIVVNAKTSRPSVCNAAESLLVHADVADRFLPVVLDALTAAGVTLHTDERALATARRHGIAAQPATDADWDTEFLSLDLAVRVVDSMDDALDHIRAHGSGHTEAVLTDSETAAQRFVAEVDAAVVMVNASTRFTDGSEFGFGAEIGVSTQKLHARGPMGLPELTSTKYVVTGSGQTRG
jgi:glutamate-5-semialdehyde dehydrogenase